MTSCLNQTIRQRGLREKGLSLVELMVAMAIGLVVVGAVFTNYLNNASGSRQTAALAQVTSDASIALGILRNHIAIAGYSKPMELSSSTGIATFFSGENAALVGCDNGLKTDGTNLDISALRCNDAPKTGETVQGNSLMVRYETDTDISPEVTTDIDKGGGKTEAESRPSDCTGTGIATADSESRYISINRFFIRPETTSQPPGLACSGNSGVAAGLVDNVSELRVWYGLGVGDGTTGKMMRVVRYVDAGQITAPGAANWQERWGEVLSVRVCVVVRSQDEVLLAATPYRGCDQNIVNTPPDRRIYRAFTSTVLINNRLSSAAFK